MLTISDVVLFHLISSIPSICGSLQGSSNYFPMTGWCCGGFCTAWIFGDFILFYLIWFDVLMIFFIRSIIFVFEVFLMIIVLDSVGSGCVIYLFVLFILFFFAAVQESPNSRPPSVQEPRGESKDPSWRVLDHRDGTSGHDYEKIQARKRHSHLLQGQDQIQGEGGGDGLAIGGAARFFFFFYLSYHVILHHPRTSISQCVRLPQDKEGSRTG